MLHLLRSDFCPISFRSYARCDGLGTTNEHAGSDERYRYLEETRVLAARTSRDVTRRILVWNSEPREQFDGMTVQSLKNPAERYARARAFTSHDVRFHG